MRFLRPHFVALFLAMQACTSHPSVVIPPGRGAVRVEITADFMGAVKPLADAVTTLALADRSRVPGEVRTDSSGVVLFNNLDPARYSLRIRAIGFEAVQREFTVSRGKLRSERALLESEIHCPAPTEGRVAICM